MRLEAELPSSSSSERKYRRRLVAAETTTTTGGAGAGAGTGCAGAGCVGSPEAPGAPPPPVVCNGGEGGSAVTTVKDAAAAAAGADAAVGAAAAKVACAPPPALATAADMARTTVGSSIEAPSPGRWESMVDGRLARGDGLGEGKVNHNRIHTQRVDFECGEGTMIMWPLYKENVNVRTVRCTYTIQKT